METFQKRILITLGIGVLLILMFFIITEAITKYTGFSVSVEENDFEVCLMAQEIILYINTADSASTLEDIQLRNKLDDFDFSIMNCLRNKEFCSNKGINEFPTWIINEQVIAKDINFLELEEYSGCELIK